MRGARIIEQRAKRLHASAQRADVDALERLVAQKLCDQTIALGRFLSEEEARVKSVLRADQLFERGHGFRLDGDEPRPSFLREPRAPAQPERDRKQRHRERAGEEQDSRSKFAAAHGRRIACVIRSVDIVELVDWCSPSSRLVH